MTVETKTKRADKIEKILNDKGGVIYCALDELATLEQIIKSENYEGKASVQILLLQSIIEGFKLENLPFYAKENCMYEMVIIIVLQVKIKILDILTNGINTNGVWCFDMDKLKEVKKSLGMCIEALNDIKNANKWYFL